MTLRLDIRDRRIGRINISAGTDSRKVQRARKALIHTLLKNGDTDAIELLRLRRLGIAEVERAYEAERLSKLVESCLATQPLPNGKRSVVSVGQAVDALLRSLDGNCAAGSYTTWSGFGKALKDHFTPNLPLSDVTREMAEDFLKKPRSKTGEMWAVTSRHHVRSFARRVWTHAGVPEKASPWEKLKLPKQKATRHAFLLPEEWRRLYRRVQGTQWAAPFALGTLAGLRIGEVCHLRTDVDVDLKRKLIRIQARGGEYPWTPKTENSEADVPMSVELHRILSEHARLGFAGERYFIRLNRKDQPMKVNTLEKYTEHWFKAVGLRYGSKGDGLTNHSLRHTYGSWMAQANVPLLKIAKLMRDTPETVAKFYARLMPGDLEGPAEQVGQIASGEAE